MIDNLIEKPISNFTPLVETIRKVGLGEYGNGPWIAGGAALAVAMGEISLSPHADIDIFCKTGTLEEVRQYLRLHLKGCVEVKQKPAFRDFLFQHAYCGDKITNPNQTFEIKSHKLQLIEFQTYSDLLELFRDFDFTVAMFATNGETLIAPEQAWKDLRNRVLRANKVNRKIFYRLGKYCRLGFTPTCDLIEAAGRATITEVSYQGNFRANLRDGY